MSDPTEILFLLPPKKSNIPLKTIKWIAFTNVYAV
jgi:hypothetical protein